MIGFISAGSSFASKALDENIWAFLSLSVLLATSRLMLAIQYLMTIGFIYRKLRSAVKGLSIIVIALIVTSATYTAVSNVFFSLQQVVSTLT